MQTNLRASIITRFTCSVNLPPLPSLIRLLVVVCASKSPPLLPRMTAFWNASSTTRTRARSFHASDLARHSPLHNTEKNLPAILPAAAATAAYSVVWCTILCGDPCDHHGNGSIDFHETLFPLLPASAVLVLCCDGQNGIRPSAAEPYRERFITPPSCRSFPGSRLSSRSLRLSGARTALLVGVRGAPCMHAGQFGRSITQVRALALLAD